MQGVLEEAVADVCAGARVGISAASKTDAGTHAVGQVVHFDPTRALCSAL